MHLVFFIFLTKFAQQYGLLFQRLLNKQHTGMSECSFVAHKLH